MEKIHYPNNTVQWKRTIAGGVAVLTQTFNSSGSLTKNESHYLIKDHLGTLSLITDHNGAVSHELYSDPWGQPIKPMWDDMWGEHLAAPDTPYLKQASTVTLRGFTGHEHLDEVGVVHMNGRIYDPRLARFMQADPIIQDPTTPRSLNRYSYVWNNPLNATDPSGFVTRGHACRESYSRTCEEVTPDNDLDERDRQRDMYDDWDDIDRDTAEFLAEFWNNFAEINKSKNAYGDGGGSVTVQEVPPSSTERYQNGAETVAARTTQSGPMHEMVVIGKRYSAQKGYTEADKKSMGALIQNLGQSSGLLDSDFEIELFQRWWNGDGSNLEIDQATFQEILSVGRIDMRNLRSVPLSNGTSGYATPINTYGSSKYNYAIGTATVYLDSNKQPVGFIDFYNFNRGNRASFVAERVTRNVGELGEMYDAKDYYIYRGVLGP